MEIIIGGLLALAFFFLLLGVGIALSGVLPGIWLIIRRAVARRQRVSRHADAPEIWTYAGMLKAWGRPKPERHYAGTLETWRRPVVIDHGEAVVPMPSYEDKAETAVWEANKSLLPRFPVCTCDMSLSSESSSMECRAAVHRGEPRPEPPPDMAGFAMETTGGGWGNGKKSFPWGPPRELDRSDFFINHPCRTCGMESIVNQAQQCYDCAELQRITVTNEWGNSACHHRKRTKKYDCEQCLAQPWPTLPSPARAPERR